MLYIVRIVTEAGFAPLVEAGLELAGYAAASHQDADSGETRFECYYRARREAELEVAALDAGLREWLQGERGWTLAVVELPDAEWRDAWKHFFRAERVSPNVMVRPPWEAAEAGVRCVVEINPGLSFGTGRHFTTRSCLQLLDRLGERLPGASLVDAGCGSGILAIAAAKLGFTRVTAFDNDPQAMISARDNAVINGVAARVALVQAGVDTFVAEAPFDVVVANIYDELLRRYAPALTGLVGAGVEARLVLSGMLRAQVAGVRAVYVDLGWVQEDLLEDQEWASLLLKRG